MAKATFRHAVVPAAKAALNMAANALSPPGAPVSQAVVGIGPFGTSLPPVRPGAGPAVGTVTPLIVDAVRTTSAALGRTASRALAVLMPCPRPTGSFEGSECMVAELFGLTPCPP